MSWFRRRSPSRLFVDAAGDPGAVMQEAIERTRAATAIAFQHQHQEYTYRLRNMDAQEISRIASELDCIGCTYTERHTAAIATLIRHYQEQPPVTDPPTFQPGDQVIENRAGRRHHRTVKSAQFTLNDIPLIVVADRTGHEFIADVTDLAPAPPPVTDKPLYVLFGNPDRPLALEFGMSPGALARSTHVLRIDTDGTLNWIKGGPA